MLTICATQTRDYRVTLQGPRKHNRYDAIIRAESVDDAIRQANGIWSDTPVTSVTQAVDHSKPLSNADRVRFGFCGGWITCHNATASYAERLAWAAGHPFVAGADIDEVHILNAGEL